MIEINGLPLSIDVEIVLDTLAIETGFLDEIRKEANNNIMFTCPNPEHSLGHENTPSCGILTDDLKRGKHTYSAGTVHCFTCGFTTDLAGLVSACFGYNDQGKFGYNWLIDNFISVEIEMRKPLKLFQEEVTSEVTIIDEKKFMKKYYNYDNNYLKLRGIPDTIKNFFGVGYDKDIHAVVFPVYDKNLKLLGVSKRPINPTSKLRYVNEGFEKSTTLFGLKQVIENIDRIDELYIVEGFIDCLTLWARKTPALALMGALVTEDQINILNDLPVRKYIAMLDNPIIDKAGARGLKKLQNSLTNKLLWSYKYPVIKKDANDLTDEEFAQGEIIL